MMTLQTLPLPGLPPTESPPTLFVEDSRALTLAMRVGGSDLTANVPASIHTESELLTKYDPITSSWKTSQLCLDGDLQEFLGTWPRSGMTRNGTAYRLPTLAESTSGTEYGLLPTPAAREGRDWSKAKILARLDRGGCVARRICNLSSTLRLSEEIVGLNPCFAEWMMGYPEKWTDLKP